MRSWAVLGALLVFLWTNPPEPDTARVQFFVTAQDSLGGSWTFDVPVSFDRDRAPAGPGESVEMNVKLPCYEGRRTFAVSAVAYDSTGNASGPGNVITFTGSAWICL